MGRKLAAAVSAAVVAALTASGALAGEIKGPPGTGPCYPVGSTQGPICNFTAAPDHANSIFAFSGLNDLNPAFGQTDRQTQTPKDGPPGTPGHGLGPNSPFPIGCRGGSNPDNPPSP